MCVLHIISWCFTLVRSFIKISGTVFNLQSGHEYMVEMAIFNVQRAITLNVGKLELRFMRSARHLIMLYIWVKFCENISNSFELTERKGVHVEWLCSMLKGQLLQKQATRVMVHVFCMSHQNALHLCEVSWKYLWWHQSYREDTSDGSADGRTDTQSIGRYYIIPSPRFVVRHKMLKN